MGSKSEHELLRLYKVKRFKKVGQIFALARMGKQNCKPHFKESALRFMCKFIKLPRLARFVVVASMRETECKRLVGKTREEYFNAHE